MSRRVPKRRSQTRFDIAPQATIARSTFDLSHPVKTTFDSGYLIPLPPMEVLPGDSFRVRMTALCRQSTPVHPTMDNLIFESFFFFVPNRLTWTSWQKFMGEQENPSDSTDFIVPQIGTGAVLENTIGDYFGLPIGVPITSRISALPFRAYSRIWNEWFRDENLQDSIAVDYSDSANAYRNVFPYRRGKRKNYITSALPWPQKGPGVDIPIGTTAPVLGIGIVDPDTVSTNPGELIRESDGQKREYTTGRITSASPGIALEADASPSGYPTIYTDLSNATGATINDWRQAFQIQKLQERDARGGTRYTEILRSHFQVVSPDSRLQRSEILSTGIQMLQMNAVPQTSSTDATTPQGNLSAFGQTGITNHGFTKSFVEHGYIIGMFSVRADLTFQQKIDRHWSRQTKYDFYWPALQALGEQPVYQKEVYTDGTAQDETVWGYQERWAEYRQIMGHITGRFRSASTTPLDAWHYALDFGATPPALNDSFIQEKPPVARTLAITDGSEPEFIFDAWLDVRAARPMPVYSVPGYIDHF